MKRNGICFLNRPRMWWIGLCFVLIAVLAGLAAGLGIGGRHIRYEEPLPGTVYETETVPETRLVIQSEETAASEPATEAMRTERYFLVSETEYLLVFTEGNKEECMQTHIPITDFPEEEQEKLREGIWFHSMMEVFFYLESYTS